MSVMKKEWIITIVGFLGSGKTTLLKKLLFEYIKNQYSPYVILNDYENANLDAQQLTNILGAEFINPLNGSCICCSGIGELRNLVNRIPEREKGITIIEANGTSDACSLMGFLGVGINERFSPPVQVSVVDVKNWQNRSENNELEANQIQVSSLIVLTHLEGVSENQINEVIKSLRKFNPLASIEKIDSLDISNLKMLSPLNVSPNKMDHQKAHWSSCSVELPCLPSLESIEIICNNISSTILRVKGVTKIEGDEHFTYFERTPDGSIMGRKYNGVPITGPMLVTIGPGSDPEILEKIVESVTLTHKTKP